jgi:hypothetical protein
MISQQGNKGKSWKNGKEWRTNLKKLLASLGRK